MGFQLNAGQANPAFYPGSFSFDSLTPDALAGTVNDWDPPGLSGVSCILINATSQVTLTGLAGGTPNRQILLINQSNFDINIVAQASGSAAANRFSVAATLSPGAGITLIYNTLLAQWIAAGSGSAFGPGSVLQIVQDFINPQSDGWDDTLVGGGSAVSQRTGESGHPGIMRCETGTTSTGNAGRGYSVDSSTAFAPIIVGGGEIIIDCVMRIPILATDAENVFPRAGLMDEISSVPNNGVYITTVKNADPEVMVWGAIARAGGSSTPLTSTIAVVANVWTHTRLVINAAGTAAELFVDGVSGGSVSTGFPSAGMTVAAQAAKSAGGTNRQIEFDLLVLTQTLNANRYLY